MNRTSVETTKRFPGVDPDELCERYRRTLTREEFGGATKCISLGVVGRTLNRPDTGVPGASQSRNRGPLEPVWGLPQGWCMRSGYLHVKITTNDKEVTHGNPTSNLRNVLKKLTAADETRAVTYISEEGGPTESDPVSDEE